MKKNVNDWKDRLSVVYSTNPDYKYETEEEIEPETLAPENQNLKVGIDKKGRKGKQVTLISGFVGKTEDLEKLEKLLKNKCGVGGSSKDGEILIQGNLTVKIFDILKELKYKVKKIN